MKKKMTKFLLVWSLGERKIFENAHLRCSTSADSWTLQASWMAQTSCGTLDCGARRLEIVTREVRL